MTWAKSREFYLKHLIAKVRQKMVVSFFAYNTFENLKFCLQRMPLVLNDWAQNFRKVVLSNMVHVESCKCLWFPMAAGDIYILYYQICACVYN